MKLEYIKTDPTSNITVLVRTPVERAKQPEAAEKIMAADRQCEQVGFIEESESGPRLQMMGGEFCGNASMSLAAVMASEKDADSAVLSFAVSGAETPVTVRVRRAEDGYQGSVEMPLPTEFKKYDFGRYSAQVVRFQGIAHAIVTNAMPVSLAEMLIREWCGRVKSDAFGIMLLDENSSRLTPVVYVPSTDTVVRESSCASGTAAVGAWAALNYGGAVKLVLDEPGGSMSVAAEAENGTVAALTLTGKVKVLETGTLEIP
jgi:diaminopimelate epimerase